MNWLERARREIQECARRPTANSAERTLTAVMAVPRQRVSGKSRGTPFAAPDVLPSPKAEAGERAAILEHDAGLPRPEAQIEAARITAILARNRKYLWASLRSALRGYPELLSQVARPGGACPSAWPSWPCYLGAGWCARSVHRGA